MRTLKPGLTKEEMSLNSCLGLCGESREASEIYKKHKFHNHKVDKAAFLKELGDICWYLAEAATAIDILLEEVIQANISKLRERYPAGFSIERTYHD